ncbi:hypothetical protein HDU96_006126 [Phlyctochytrium bullatum]|nr:hypothetical protein HDU96_006126 [Phlyctochytrium bullatum]
MLPTPTSLNAPSGPVWQDRTTSPPVRTVSLAAHICGKAYPEETGRTAQHPALSSQPQPPTASLTDHHGKSASVTHTSTDAIPPNPHHPHHHTAAAQQPYPNTLLQPHGHYHHQLTLSHHHHHHHHHASHAHHSHQYHHHYLTHPYDVPVRRHSADPAPASHVRPIATAVTKHRSVRIVKVPPPNPGYGREQIPRLSKFISVLFTHVWSSNSLAETLEWRISPMLVTFVQNILEITRMPLPVITLAIKYVQRLRRLLMIQAESEGATGSSASATARFSLSASAPNSAWPSASSSYSSSAKPSSSRSSRNGLFAGAWAFGPMSEDAKVLSVALILAQKFSDDAPYGNRVWGQILGLASGDLSRLEARFMALIGFNLYVTESEYVSFCKGVQALAREWNRSLQTQQQEQQKRAEEAQARQREANATPSPAVADVQHARGKGPLPPPIDTTAPVPAPASVAIVSGLPSPVSATVAGAAGAAPSTLPPRNVSSASTLSVAGGFPKASSSMSTYSQHSAEAVTPSTATATDLPSFTLSYHSSLPPMKTGAAQAPHHHPFDSAQPHAHTHMVQRYSACCSGSYPAPRLGYFSHTAQQGYPHFSDSASTSSTTTSPATYTPAATVSAEVTSRTAPYSSIRDVPFRPVPAPVLPGGTATTTTLMPPRVRYRSASMPSTTCIPPHRYLFDTSASASPRHDGPSAPADAAAPPSTDPSPSVAAGSVPPLAVPPPLHLLPRRTSAVFDASPVGAASAAGDGPSPSLWTAAVPAATPVPNGYRPPHHHCFAVPHAAGAWQPHGAEETWVPPLAAGGVGAMDERAAPPEEVSRGRKRKAWDEEVDGREIKGVEGVEKMGMTGRDGVGELMTVVEREGARMIKRQSSWVADH